MGKNPGGAESQHGEDNEQEEDQGNGKSAPEGYSVFEPIDLTGFGGLDLCQLGNVVSIGIGQTAAEIIAFGLHIGDGHIGGGKVKVCSGQLVADFR